MGAFQTSSNSARERPLGVVGPEALARFQPPSLDGQGGRLLFAQDERLAPFAAGVALVKRLGRVAELEPLATIKLKPGFRLH